MSGSKFLLGLSLCVGLIGCGDDSTLPIGDSGPQADTSATSDTGPGTPDAGSSDDAGPTPDTSTPDAGAGAALPGSACDCDTECEGSATNPGICVQGICMTSATGACAAAGSSDECPDHSRCWNFQDSPICWPDSDHFDCAGDTDSDGSCAPNASNSCDESCSEFCGDGGDDCPPNSSMSGDGCACDEGFVVNEERTACVRECMMPSDCGDGLTCIDNMCVTPPCTPGSCGDSAMCDTGSGVCIIDIGTPPPGPVPTCSAGVGMVPDWECTSGCGDVVPFDPDMGPGYWDYALNGETNGDQYRSYVRRDVMMLVKYATAMVACQTGAWDFGNGDAPLGLGDMSEADGSIPGTREGSPGHPPGTHVNGHDMDIGYYQTGTPNNVLRAICEHRTGGADQYHCTGPTTLLDPWRTALFLGHLHINSNLRVIGVDGRAGGPILSATTQLCSGGWLETSACSSAKITFEETDGGAGWYRFHHHHLHISVSAPRARSASFSLPHRPLDYPPGLATTDVPREFQGSLSDFWRSVRRHGACNHQHIDLTESVAGTRQLGGGKEN
ncbi:MAG: hypothetical protein AB8H86_15350 [Polyangiales bacterium]